MCKYSFLCKHTHKLNEHCYYCHGHKIKNCWFHCSKWNSFWLYHTGKYPNAEPHSNENCIHIAENAHSSLSIYDTKCTICQKTTVHYRTRRLDNGHLI